MTSKGSGHYLVLVALYGVGMTAIALRGASSSAIVHEVLIIGGPVALFLAAYASFVAVVSAWAYSAAKPLAESGTSIFLRGGSSPALRRLLEDDLSIRHLVERTRPVGRYFLLAAGADGITIWHGSAHSGATGGIAGSLITAVRAGIVKEGSGAVVRW